MEKNSRGDSRADCYAEPPTTPELVINLFKIAKALGLMGAQPILRRADGVIR